MAFVATLSFAGTKYEVLDYRYSIKRNVDSKGHSSSNICGGQIRLRVVSTNDTSILENMVNNLEPHTGSIIFKKSDKDAKAKELYWEDGYTIEFEESIDIDSIKPMTITFIVSAQVIKMASV